MTVTRITRSNQRAHKNHGWLDTHHSFSFADWYDPTRLSHSNLRVLNQDRIQQGTGFGAHPHKDMEIVSYVLEGALGHQDNMGNQHTIRPGDVQRMTAGTGIVHAEQNAHPGTTEFLQMWIIPDQTGLPPSYDQKSFELQNGWTLVAAPAKEAPASAVGLNANAHLWAATPDPGDELQLDMPRPTGYLHVARGHIQIDGEDLHAGDAAIVSGNINLKTIQASNLILWGLP